MPITESQLLALKQNNETLHQETRACIKSALVELLKIKQYPDISMSDIIRKSGISRTGVYKNYKSKAEIMFDIYGTFLDDIIDALSSSIYNNVEIIYTIAYKNKSALKALIDAGLEYHLLDMMNKCYEDVADPYYMPMWMGMIYNVLIKWAKTGMDDPLETTVERIAADIKLVAESIDKAAVVYFKSADRERNGSILSVLNLPCERSE